MTAWLTPSDRRYRSAARVPYDLDIAIVRSGRNRRGRDGSDFVGARAFHYHRLGRPRTVVSSGHSRLPRYVRGHSGVVELVQPPSVLPDTNAHFEGENPQYVYTVRFDSHEPWGAEAEPFALTIEMFESYLDKTT